jgi:hypothetical protein
MNSQQLDFESYRDTIFQHLEAEGVMLHPEDEGMDGFIERLRTAYEQGMPVRECAESIHDFIRESDDIGAVDAARHFLHTARIMEESVCGENGDEPATDRMILLASLAAQRRMIENYKRLMDIQIEQLAVLKEIRDRLDGNAKEK